jgi:signal transduction histidine kinase
MVTLHTGKSCSNVIMGVYKPDDTLTWISINSQPLCRSGENDPYAVIASFHDITDRLNSARMKDEFISVVSHELRTPLTSIRGALGILSGGSLLADTKQTATMVEIALRNCDRLMFLINDLLDMEKIASGKLRYKFDTVSLDESIRAALSVNAPYAEKFKVRFQYESPQTSINVRADHDRLLQILTNLLSNAAKFSGEATTVTISVDRSDNEYVKVSVSDQGAGVPDDFRGKVFTKFAQADGSTTRQQGGTGLGLAITKSLVEQHGGTINFFNNTPRGATFYFTLPMAKNAQNAG